MYSKFHSKVKKVVALVMAFCLVGAIFMPQSSFASDRTGMSVTNINLPKHQYIGKGFWVKGYVKSDYKLAKVRCGIMNTKKKWISGMNFIKNTSSKSFDLDYFDSKIIFGKLKAGTYYYRVWARNSNGQSENLVTRKFTVSQIKGSGTTKPDSKIAKGKSVSLRGYVKSKFKLSRVKVGITDNSGKWKSGFVVTTNPKSRNYNIENADTSIKFGKLAKGTYRYKVYAKDTYGKSKYVVNKKFTVGGGAKSQNANGSIKKGGFRLKYNGSVISAIGKQPVSGPCGQYGMAYSRAILDGSFPLKKKYKSYYKQLYWEYGLGSHYAYWYKADGSPVWYSTAKSCYKAALSEVASGKPCVINLHNKSTGNNHFVTVIGYVPGTTKSNVSLKSFIAIDPGYGVVKYLRDMNYRNSGNPECVFFD